MSAVLLKAAAEAEYLTTLVFINKHRAAPEAARAVLLDHWGMEKIDRPASDGGPGDHGHPEIGSLEYDFYRTLTAGQQDTYRQLRALVDDLFERGIPWGGIDPYRIDESVEAWKIRALHELATHPMSAFLLGQMLATEALGSATHRPLVPDDRRAIEFLEHYSFNEIASKFEALKGDLRHALVRGIENGENPREVARRLANELKDYETQWGVVAITETARAESQGRLREFQDQGVKLIVGSSAHDRKVCPKCLELIDAKVHRLADVIGVSNYGVKQDAWKATIPLHPRCRCVWLPYLGASHD